MGARETAHGTNHVPSDCCVPGTKAYVSDSNQFKIYIESEVRIFWVYGDFSATLYDCVYSHNAKDSSYTFHPHNLLN